MRGGLRLEEEERSERGGGLCFVMSLPLKG
jgi:hypothetical protein